jgi:hypothetical protein
MLLQGFLKEISEEHRGPLMKGRAKPHGMQRSDAQREIYI